MFADEHLPYTLIGFGVGVFSAFGIIWLDAAVRYFRYWKG